MASFENSKEQLLLRVQAIQGGSKALSSDASNFVSSRNPEKSKEETQHLSIIVIITVIICYIRAVIKLLPCVRHSAMC